MPPGVAFSGRRERRQEPCNSSTRPSWHHGVLPASQRCRAASSTRWVASECAPDRNRLAAEFAADAIRGSTLSRPVAGSSAHSGAVRYEARRDQERRPRAKFHASLEIWPESTGKRWVAAFSIQTVSRRRRGSLRVVSRNLPQPSISTLLAFLVPRWLGRTHRVKSASRARYARRVDLQVEPAVGRPKGAPQPGRSALLRRS